MAAEEPRYEVLRSTDDYEIRRYAAYVVAETDVEGTFRAAGGKAFNILAAYIFGENSQSKKMAMTVPVESRPTGNTIRMETTAAADSSAGDARRFVYSFVMESRYTLKTLPEPRDPRIRLRQRPERTIAARRFRGSWSVENFARHERILLDALARDGIAALGAPLSARYNAPFVPSFLRRNEVMVVIGASGDTAADAAAD